MKIGDEITVRVPMVAPFVEQDIDDDWCDIEPGNADDPESDEEPDDESLIPNEAGEVIRWWQRQVVPGCRLIVEDMVDGGDVIAALMSRPDLYVRLPAGNVELWRGANS